MGATCSTLAWGVGSACAPRCCGCVCPAQVFAGDAVEDTSSTAVALTNGHLAWVSPWCCACRVCCSERHVTEAVTKRQPHPPPFVSTAPGKLVPFDQYNEEVKAADGEGGVAPNPPFSGDTRSADGGGNSKAFPWLGQGMRPFGQIVKGGAPGAAGEDLPDATALMTLIAGPRGDDHKFEPDRAGTNALLPLAAASRIALPVLPLPLHLVLVLVWSRPSAYRLCLHLHPRLLLFRFPCLFLPVVVLAPASAPVPFCRNGTTPRPRPGCAVEPRAHAPRLNCHVGAYAPTVDCSTRTVCRNARFLPVRLGARRGQVPACHVAATACSPATCVCAPATYRQRGAPLPSLHPRPPCPGAAR